MLDYTGLKAETYPGSTGASVDMPPSNWPTYGIITFESVSLTYPDTGVRALRNIYCCFRAYEKVGQIVSILYKRCAYMGVPPGTGVSYQKVCFRSIINVIRRFLQ